MLCRPAILEAEGFVSALEPLSACHLTLSAGNRKLNGSWSTPSDGVWGDMAGNGYERVCGTPRSGVFLVGLGLTVFPELFESTRDAIGIDPKDDAASGGEPGDDLLVSLPTDSDSTFVFPRSEWSRSTLTLFSCCWICSSIRLRSSARVCALLP